MYAMNVALFHAGYLCASEPELWSPTGKGVGAPNSTQTDGVSRRAGGAEDSLCRTG